VKVKGKKLYEYARQGIEVERPSRIVTIHEIELLDDDEVFEGEEVTFRIRVVCGKGTYIRTLAVQIGELLGFPSHMAELVRTASGSFTKEQCVTIREVEEKMAKGEIFDILLPIEYALSDFPYIEIDETNKKQILNGQILELHSLLIGNEKIVFGIEGKAVAVYKEHPTKEGFMKPDKMFPNSM